MLFALRHWKLLLGGLALSLALGMAGYYRIDRDHWRAFAKTLRIDLDRVKVATELADQKARAAKLAQEAEYRRKADEADREYQADLADARARADRYARLNRVRSQAGGAPSGTVTPAPDCDPQDAQRPCGTPDMVAVSADDFRILNENTIRLQAAREWALGLNGQGPVHD